MTDDDSTPIVDITNPTVFVVAAVLMMLFGSMVGLGIYVTFSGLAISFSQGISIIIVLFITCGIIGYFPYLYRDYQMKWGMFAPDDEGDEEDE